MIPIHIKIKEETYQKINNYKLGKKISYSRAIDELVDIGTNYKSILELIEKLEIKLNEIKTKEYLLQELIMQLYSDLEIVNLTNPKKNEALNKFFSKKRKGNDD